RHRSLSFLGIASYELSSRDTKASKEIQQPPQRLQLVTFWRLHHMVHSSVLVTMAAMGDIHRPNGEL
ncbi:MAG: hypothetical protein V3W52_08660, partial [Syntrophobacteria bacterium]